MDRLFAERFDMQEGESASSPFDCILYQLVMWGIAYGITGFQVGLRITGECFATPLVE